MPKYYNREEWASSPINKPILKEAKIISLSPGDDDANQALHKGILPDGCTLLTIVGGSNNISEDIDLEYLKKEKPNVVFVSHPEAKEVLATLLTHLPSIEWVHIRWAGIDFCLSETVINPPHNPSLQMTNARGLYCSTLAEYTMMAISYFAKDLPRLLKQKDEKEWNEYCVEEIRGKTLGIVGYGDIGKAVAKLAFAYGMKINALRRNPNLSDGDPIITKVLGSDKKSLHQLMKESDYILVAAPLTKDTKGLIDAESLSHIQSNAVLINLGRGPVLDEDALIDALSSRQLKGAALDVVTVEPLPKSSPLWDLDNVLISPHNMYMTETFMHESVDFFINKNLPRFVRGEELLNPVDRKAGY